VTAAGDWLTANADLDRLDREVLLCQAAGLTRAQLLARPERPLDAAAVCRLTNWAERRRRGEPVAYILGRKEFWGLELEVSPAVLVPRPDTELLVEVGLELLASSFFCGSGLQTATATPMQSRSGDRSHRGGASVLELGTGSGAVAIALAREHPAARITATDVSAEALAVARRNGARHAVEITWVGSDWFTAIDGTFDVILSNPPYVPADDPHLGALGNEPRGAVVAGADGLDAIRHISAGAAAHLQPGGALALEHGWDQAAAVRVLLETAGFTGIETRRDLGGQERVTFGRRPGASP